MCVSVNSYISLLVSPSLDYIGDQQLQIYWNIHPDEYEFNDTIAVYEQEPSNNAHQIYTQQIINENGIENTGIFFSMKYDVLSKFNFVQQCITFHVAWLRKGEILKTNCLSTQPNWMSERKELLNHRTLKNIIIPGTHSSAAFQTYYFRKTFFDIWTRSHVMQVGNSLIYPLMEIIFAFALRFRNGFIP